ncbi:MAG: RidA family protein [Ruminococcaceae bacterium]|nr:RidA family protein [Oscillospiraceae bacterium]
MIRINTDQAPAAIGPYAQGYISGSMVYTSGQIPADPATGDIVGDDIVTQAHRACQNVGTVLRAGGTDYEHVVKTTCFLADMGDFAAFNQVYAAYFTGAPARSCVAVKTLPRGVLCEIEAVAER